MAAAANHDYPDRLLGIGARSVLRAALRWPGCFPARPSASVAGGGTTWRRCRRSSPHPPTIAWRASSAASSPISAPTSTWPRTSAARSWAWCPSSTPARSRAAAAPRSSTARARRLFARGGAYAEELAPEEAAVLVASAFRFLSAPGPELRVRALTPDYASEGWDAPVSIIETVMPDRAFIVDTIRLRLERAGVPLMALLHPIFAARRDPSGRLELLADPDGGTPRESFTHIAIPRSTDTAALARLEADIRDALEDVRLVTDDFAAMVARAQAVAAELDGLGRSRSAQLATEATAVADFLRWLVDGAFVFLGYRES